jgi:hypothetical protein
MTDFLWECVDADHDTFGYLWQDNSLPNMVGFAFTDINFCLAVAESDAPASQWAVYELSDDGAAERVGKDLLSYLGKLFSEAPGDDWSDAFAEMRAILAKLEKK